MGGDGDGDGDGNLGALARGAPCKLRVSVVQLPHDQCTHTIIYTDNRRYII